MVDLGVVDVVVLEDRDERGGVTVVDRGDFLSDTGVLVTV